VSPSPPSRPSTTSLAPQFRAAHEAGHVVVFLACGIPVLWADATPTVTNNGWTETDETEWMRASQLSTESKIVRRLLGKAGGVAGEMAADLYNAELSWGAADDVGQIGAAFQALGFLARDASVTPPSMLLASFREALRIVNANRTLFDFLRERLAIGRVVIADLPPFEVVACTPEEEALFVAGVTPPNRPPSQGP